MLLSLGYTAHIVLLVHYSRGGIMLRNFFAREEGQGLVEYALILVLIAIVVNGILTILGNQVSTVFETISDGLNTE